MPRRKLTKQCIRQAGRQNENKIDCIGKVLGRINFVSPCKCVWTANITTLGNVFYLNAAHLAIATLMHHLERDLLVALALHQRGERKAVDAFLLATEDSARRVEVAVIHVAQLEADGTFVA